jgi:tellurite resistance protein
MHARQPAAKVTPKREQNSMSESFKNFPIAFFSVVMGEAGTTIAWKRAEAILGLESHISMMLLWSSIAIFPAILFICLIKIFKYPREIRKEFQNITKLSFSRPFASRTDAFSTL